MFQNIVPFEKSINKSPNLPYKYIIKYFEILVINFQVFIMSHTEERRTMNNGHIKSNKLLFVQKKVT